MPGKVDKVILSHRAALTAKYGAAGAASLAAALQALIQADLGRGLVTELVWLDDAAQMQGLPAPAITRPGDPAQAKAAIDGVYRALAPDYLIILGAPDVVPHQDLRNPVYAGPAGDDPDEFAYGDLPYACDAPYSQDANDFKGPTRVVSRLPDRQGAQTPDGLVALIRRAANPRSQPRSNFGPYFAASAQVWEASSRQSARNMFGSDADLQLVPPAGPPWPAPRLNRLVHFFNCHGASDSDQFYGQPASGAHQYPPALVGSGLVGQVSEGAVMAAECCYGGQLYATSAAQPQPPICNRYLENGASAAWVSTTIAYGPSSGNGQADLITQYFITSVLGGASIGRAALEARQAFVRAASPSDPSDLKTLAQFNLYGDASVQPVAVAPHLASPLGVTAQVTARSERLDRRLLLARQGQHLLQTEPRLERSERPASDAVLAQLRQHAQASGGDIKQTLRFDVRQVGEAKAPALLETFAQVPDGYVVAFVETDAPADIPVTPVKLVIGRLRGEALTSVQIAVSR
jgi:hypothetical protein